MENKIEITPATTVDELIEIIDNNATTEIAKAFHAYMIKQTNEWYEQYARSDKAEKELAEANAAILNWAIKQMNQ